MVEAGGEALVEAIVSVATAFSGRLVLIPTEERSVRTVSAARDRFPENVITAMPDSLTVNNLMDKRVVQEIAEGIHFPVPRTVFVRSTNDLAVARSFRFPCVLKPTTKDYEYGKRFDKAYRCLGFDELEARYTQVCGYAPEMVVQEWVEGSDSDVYFCLQYVAPQGDPVISFVGRKLRQWPPDVGGTASATSAPQYHQQLTELTTQFFRDTRFWGLGSIEYKRDPRDGRFVMVEPTVSRTNFQEETATLNGFNVVAAAFQHATGRPVVSGLYANPAVIWREPEFDELARAAGSGNADVDRIVAKRMDAYFRVDDPGVWVGMQWQRVRRRLKRLIGSTALGGLR